jgi:hypothetical protein
VVDEINSFGGHFRNQVALADRDRHGYAIMREIAERTGGQIQRSPSTLYSAIQRLLEAGLISELAERPDPATTTISVGGCCPIGS